jgi:DnaJ-domain-containing protein 1
MSERDRLRQPPAGQRPLTYYDVLDLDRDASPEEIKAAYYELARKYHPDVASQDPEMAQTFAVINEAYRILSDQQRRTQYDRTLPRKTYPLRHPTLEKIWREATDVVLIRSDRFGPLNQAMQAAVPIVLDSTMLVLTVPGSERHLSGHLETAANRNSILNALELVYGQRLDYRVIDGTTPQEWQALKQAEAKTRHGAATAAHPQGTTSTARPAAGEGPWDDLIRRMHAQYQQLPRRQYPQSRGRYLREALGWIARTDDELRYGAEGDEELQERALARAIERLAAILELPPVLVAVELDRLRRVGEV